MSLLGIAVLALGSLVFAQAGWSIVRPAQPAQRGIDYNVVYFHDSKRGWIGADEGQIRYTSDGGETWTPQMIGANDNINDLYFRSKETGYVLAGSRIFYTRDGGKEWREVRRFLAADFGGAVPELYSVTFAGKRNAWIVGSISRRDTIIDSLLIHTDDGGLSWQIRSVPTKAELIHVYFTDGDRGWIVGGSGTLLSTVDGGKSWSTRSVGTDETLYHIHLRKRSGWIVGDRGTILRTTDGGQSWQKIPADLDNTLLNVKFASDDEGWIIGRGGVILRTGDGGRTWLRQEINTTKNLFGLYFEKKTGWAVGEDGIVLRYER